MSGVNQSKSRLPHGWWTKERIFEEARRHSSKSDFHKAASQAYKIAMKEGWLDEMDWFPERKIKWTREVLGELAKSYGSKKDFRLACPRAYDAAYSKGWLSEIAEENNW